MTTTSEPSPPLFRPRRLFVAGHRGMAGQAIMRRLRARGYADIVTCGREDLDLTDQHAVRRFLEGAQPDYIFIAAAKVGGIHANNVHRADFLFDNLAIAANLIEGAHRAGIERLMFLGSSCIYPRDCPQPIREDYLLTGPLESTNEPYAIAKIAGLKLCEAFNRQHARRYVTVMPTNLYGPGDNYDLESSHVLPALLRKAHEAKATGAPLTLWGTGAARREFLYVDDLAEACVFLMERGYEGGPINVGVGEDVSILELARRILRTVGYETDLRFDATRPDGTPRKLLDVSRLTGLGWTAKTSLDQGLALTYDAYLSALASRPGPSLVTMA